MSDESQKNRAEIRKQIAKSGSKEKYILEEMKRLGFWPEDESQPIIAAELIEREAELIKEISALAKESSPNRSEEDMLKAIHTRRKKESVEKQKQTKERKKQELLEKKEKWAARKKSEIIYLGEGLTAGLNHQTSDVDKLTKKDLPIANNALELAELMGLSVNELRFLSYNRPVSKVSHYVKFQLNKKSGGFRTISAPKPRLKKAQNWILHNILNKVVIHDKAHGFVKERSILSNAKAHVGADVVINIDLKDFFPTITFRRVKGVFRGMGYSEQLSTIFGSICTEANEEKVNIDGETYFVANGPKRLPQGAPSSPMITNVICRRLDARISGVCKKAGFQYTRYADDMTISCAEKQSIHLTKVLWQIRGIIKDEDFVFHPDKLRIMRKGQRKEVTGIIVNEMLSVSRRKVRNFKALLFQIEKDGIKGKTWNGKTGIDMLDSLFGTANFIAMVKPEQGKHLVERAKKIVKSFSKADKKKPWWKIW